MFENNFKSRKAIQICHNNFFWCKVHPFLFYSFTTAPRSYFKISFYIKTLNVTSRFYSIGKSKRYAIILTPAKQFMCCRVNFVVAKDIFSLSNRPFKSPFVYKKPTHAMLHRFINSKIKRTRFSDEKKNKMLLPNIVPPQKLNVVYPLRIFPRFDQNSGNQSRIDQNRDLRLITAKGSVFKNIIPVTFETNQPTTTFTFTRKNPRQRKLQTYCHHFNRKM